MVGKVGHETFHAASEQRCLQLHIATESCQPLAELGWVVEHPLRVSGQVPAPQLRSTRTGPLTLPACNLRVEIPGQVDPEGMSSERCHRHVAEAAHSRCDLVARDGVNLLLLPDPEWQGSWLRLDDVFPWASANWASATAPPAVSSVLGQLGGSGQVYLAVLALHLH